MVVIDENKIIFDKVMKIISKFIDLDHEPDFHLTESVVFVKMILELEETFDFQFDDHKLSVYKFPTLASFVDYIVAKVYSS